MPPAVGACPARRLRQRLGKGPGANLLGITWGESHSCFSYLSRIHRDGLWLMMTNVFFHKHSSPRVQSLDGQPVLPTIAEYYFFIHSYSHCPANPQTTVASVREVYFSRTNAALRQNSEGWWRGATAIRSHQGPGLPPSSCCSSHGPTVLPVLRLSRLRSRRKKGVLKRASTCRTPENVHTALRAELGNGPGLRASTPQLNVRGLMETRCGQTVGTPALSAAGRFPTVVDTSSFL